MDILSSVLSKKISDKNDRESDFLRVFWFVQVMKWVQSPRKSEEKNQKKETIYTVRLKYLLLQLKNNPEWREHFVLNVKLLLLRVSSPAQLTSAGLPEASSFIQDFIHRLQEKILPQSPLSEDLSTLIYEIFPDEEESLYIDFIDIDVLQEVFNLFSEDAELVGRLRADLLTASYILCHQVLNLSIMIQKELDDLDPQIDKLSEFHLNGALHAHQMRHDQEISKDLLVELEAIESHMQQLFQKMKVRGVKIDLVYWFQIQKRKINRLRILMQFLCPQISTVMSFRVFISQLILETQHQKSLRSFFSENLTLLTNRIVQANSHIGEHYVTFTWQDFRRMFQSALGGGGVTAVTVIIKHFITQVGVTGFVKGFIDSLNYSVSFLSIQLMGWTLATKQPSTTAPFIASALQKSLLEARRTIVALLRTQFIAVLGNLSMVFPICFIIAWGSLQLNHPLISEPEALYMFHSTNILGPTPLYAAFTGVLLFLASLFAGWFENWILTHRIHKRIKYNNRMQKFFGQQRTQRFAEFIKEKSNPLAGNIGLGFLLGMTPQFMKFLSIPLEPRHVTLATGGFAAALPQALRAGVTEVDIVNATLGIAVTGVLNLSVSFLLAFLLASISSKVRFSSFVSLFFWGVKLILTRPWLLVVPQKIKDKEEF